MEVPFRMRISPTTYLNGLGFFCAGDTLLVHRLPDYSPKKFPEYEVRAEGPYGVSLFKSGLRVNRRERDAQQCRFTTAAEAVHFAERFHAALGKRGIAALGQCTAEGWDNDFASRYPLATDEAIAEALGEL